MESKKMIKALKMLTWIVVAHGLLCVTDSHILAWVGRVDTLEGLSSTQVTEIIAPITIYGITKTIENIFEKNDIFKKRRRNGSEEPNQEGVMEDA